MVDNSIGITYLKPELSGSVTISDDDPLRSIHFHRFYHENYHSDDWLIDSSSLPAVSTSSLPRGFFRLTKHQITTFSLCSSSSLSSASSASPRVWPMNGIFIVDNRKKEKEQETRKMMKLVIIADISCSMGSHQQQRQQQSETLKQQRNHYIETVTETLDFQTEDQVLIIVENPFDIPELWKYDILPISYLFNQYYQTNKNITSSFQFSW
jgi:hypothetical protein